MTLSQAALQAALAQSTDAVFLECLTVTHPSMAEPLRLVNDTQDLARAAGVFARFPFQVIGPSQAEDQLPGIRVAIDNVDQRVMLALRTLAGTRDETTVTYEVVLAATPDTVEYGPLAFRLDGVSGGLQSLTLELSFLRGFLNLAFPGRQFAPSNAAPL